MVVPPALVDAVRGVEGAAQRRQPLAGTGGDGGDDPQRQLRLPRHADARRSIATGATTCSTALRRNFGDLEISGEAGGLHVFWQLPPGVPDAATVEALGRRARVGVYSLDSGSVHHTGPSALSRRGLMLGYAALTPKQIDQGIARLSDAVDDALDGHAIGLSDLLAHRPLPSGPARAGRAVTRRRRSNRLHGFVSNRLSPRRRGASGSIRA